MKEWFPHDYYAHSDTRMVRLLNKCSTSGYGCYWCVIELLHTEQLSCDELIEVVTIKLNGDAKVVTSCINTMLSLGLIRDVNGVVVSDRVTRNLEYRNDVSNKRRQAGLRSAEMRGRTSVQQKPTLVEQTPTQYNTVQDITVQDSTTKSKRATFVAPTLDQLSIYALSIGLTDTDSEAFRDHYEANGWKVGRNPMKDWKSALRNWKRNKSQFTSGNRNGKPATGERVSFEKATIVDIAQRSIEALGINPDGTPIGLPDGGSGNVTRGALDSPDPRQIATTAGNATGD